MQWSHSQSNSGGRLLAPVRHRSDTAVPHQSDPRHRSTFIPPLDRNDDIDHVNFAARTSLSRCDVDVTGAVNSWVLTRVGWSHRRGVASKVSGSLRPVFNRGCGDCDRSDAATAIELLESGCRQWALSGTIDGKSNCPKKQGLRRDECLKHLDLHSAKSSLNP